MSRLPSDLVEQIRSRLDLAALVAERTALKRAGGNLTGCCPFHSERTPSFVVYDDHTYHCFGCGAHGDAFGYLMAVDGLDFRAAVEAAAQRVGVVIPADAADSGEPAGPSRTRLQAAAAFAARWYAAQLPTCTDASAYLAGRGFDAATLAAFGVGWAPGRGALVAAARAAGYADAELLAADLAVERDGQIVDRFFARVTIPLADKRGHEIAFSARVLPADAEAAKAAGKSIAKYVNSGETSIYRKGDVVFNLHRARTASRETRRLVLVEGAIDVIAAHQCGIADVVACCGTALTETQLDILRTALDGGRLVLALNSDGAGQAATFRDLGALWAAGLDVRVATLPGKDCADLLAVADGATTLAAAFDGAAPAIDWLARFLAPTTPGSQADALPLLDAALDLLARHPDHDLAAIHAETAAAALGLKPRIATKRLAARRRAAPAKPAKPAAATPPPPPSAPAPTTATPGDPDAVERADIWAASRFVEQHKSAACYCAVFGRWHVWTGKIWEEDRDGAVMRLAEATARAIAAEHLAEATRLHGEADLAASTSAEKAKALHGRAARATARADQIQSRKKLIDMIELAKSRAEIAVAPDDLDRHPYLLSCNTGTIDLRDGRVYAHTPDHRITRLCPVDYDPAADRTVLMRVLDSVCNGDPEVIAYAQAVIGQSLFGHNRLEKFYVWQGPGGSGKGTLFEGIKAAIGGYAMTAEFQTFVKVQGHRVRDDLARLAEARVVLASEVERGEQMAAAVIKAITGNDSITARQLYGTYFEFRPKLTLHLQCNDLPRVDDTDSGIWRRLVAIPCGPEIPADRRDPGVKEALLDPARGGKAILAWMVEGAVAHHAARYIPEPPAIAAASATYRRDQDPLREYFADRCLWPAAERAEGTMVAASDLVRDYHAWADEQHLSPRLRLSPRAIGERLTARGCWTHKVRLQANENKPTRVWCGLTLVSEDHLARGQSLRPTAEESEAALAAGSVPLFRSSATSEKSPRARGRACAGAHTHAHAPTHEDTFLDLRNNGTTEQSEGFPPALPDLGELPDDGEVR